MSCASVHSLVELGQMLHSSDSERVELIVKHTFLEFQMDKVASRKRSNTDSHIVLETTQPVQCSKTKRWADEMEMEDGDTLSTVSGSDAPLTSCSSEHEGDEGSDAEMPDQPAGMWAVPVFPIYPAMSGNIAMALQAKKAELGVTVAQLAAAALQAEAASSATTSHATKRVPAAVPMKSPQPMSSVESARTTLMLRHVPSEFNRTRLLEILDETFPGSYDFVYLPINFQTSQCLGFAFINFTDCTQAERARQYFQGFRAWGMPCKEVCETCWSDAYQGLAANIERCRNSSVMHESVPSEHKPILFVAGRPVTFPAPTRKIEAPRRRSSA